MIGAHDAGSPRPLLAPPGGMLMWIVVTLELFTFSIVFVFIALFRMEDTAAFATGQRMLDVRMGIAQTVALLTSGWLVAEAVHAYRAGRIPAARRFHLGGIVGGLAFVVLKIVDYISKTNAGMSLDDDFGAAYILGTGFHFIHVIAGLVLLAVVNWRMARGSYTDAETAVAGTALFWHMCDIAWFFLFPLFYAR